MSFPSVSLSGHPIVPVFRQKHAVGNGAQWYIAQDVNLNFNVSYVEELNLQYSAIIISKLNNPNIPVEEAKLLFQGIDASARIAEIIGTNDATNFFGGTPAERIIGNEIIMNLSKVQHAAIRDGTLH